MQQNTAQPLILVPLSLQISSLGGEGYNCDVKSQQVENSYSVIHTFKTPDGEKQLITLNEYCLGIVEDTMTHSVYYNGDTGEYTLRTPSELGYSPDKTISTKPLGFSFDEAFAELKKLWPNRIVWDIRRPTKSLHSDADIVA